MASKKELERRIEALERAIKQGTESHAQPDTVGDSGPTTSGEAKDIEIPFELNMQFECKEDSGYCIFCKEESGK